MIQPQSEMVAALWLETLGLAADAIGTDLPADPISWATGGYVQVSTMGGSPHPYIPERAPTVQVDCWANRPNSELPPWNRAGDLAGQILNATYEPQLVALVMPIGFRPARVQTVTVLTEPRRMPGDPSGFARVMLELIMHWTWVS